jgi:hypothetical protein
MLSIPLMRLPLVRWLEIAALSVARLYFSGFDDYLINGLLEIQPINNYFICGKVF